MAKDQWGDDPFGNIGPGAGSSNAASDTNPTMLLAAAVGIILFLVGGVMKVIHFGGTNTNSINYWIPLILAFGGLGLAVYGAKRIRE